MHFIVRGDSELYIDRLLAIVLSAKSMNKTVVISYSEITPKHGDVVTILIE